MKPFLAACGIKSAKLASIALASIQRMLANDLVALEDIPPIVQALVQVFQNMPPCDGAHLTHGCRLDHTDFSHADTWSCVKLSLRHNLPLEKVERLRDEGVQLKILQTALTLMQSPSLAEDEVSMPSYPKCSCMELMHLCLYLYST